MNVALLALPPLLLALGLIAILRRCGSKPAFPPGATAIPVRGLYLRRGALAGESRNSINPRLAVAPEGLHFRLFGAGTLPFSAIGHVELRARFGRIHLLFVNPTSPRLLSVCLTDRAAAKQLLDLLPRTLALTPEAAALRDKSTLAGSLNLPLYHGPYF